jgi:hypothetical protein
MYWMSIVCDDISTVEALELVIFSRYDVCLALGILGYT